MAGAASWQAHSKLMPQTGSSHFFCVSSCPFFVRATKTSRKIGDLSCFNHSDFVICVSTLLFASMEKTPRITLKKHAQTVQAF